MLGGGGAGGGHETGSRTHVELSGEACEARLTINRRKDMESELLWLFYDDILPGWIPPNHVVIFGTLQKTRQTGDQNEREGETRRKKGGHEQVEEKGGY